MNVAFDPWIPVLTHSGKPEQVSLEKVFTHGNEFADISVRPHERVALMRLFLCVAHAALNGPKNADEWEDLPETLPQETSRYLHKWRDSFELFHSEKPWMQISNIKKDLLDNTNSAIDTWTPISKLNFSYSTGNNTTLFDHAAIDENRQVSIEDALLSMITYQCFSPGGLISQVFWNGVQSGKSSKDAPCVPASMVHAFLKGRSIFHTISLNIASIEELELFYGNISFGRPVWEKMPRSFNDQDAVENATTTYLGRLVPLTRLYLLHHSGQRLLMGDGLVYPTFQDGFFQEPTATVVIRKSKNKEERALLSYRPDKAYWRELSAILVKKNSTEGCNAAGPLAIAMYGLQKDIDLLVCALARNQATIVDTKESTFHIPSKLSENLSVFDNEVDYADRISNRLKWAIEGYRVEIDGGWEGRIKSAGVNKSELKNKLSFTANNNYWTSVERNLPMLFSFIESIDTDEAVSLREIWRKMLWSSACESYQIACGQETSRQIRAYAKGFQRLVSMKNSVEKEAIKETEDEK